MANSVTAPPSDRRTPVAVVGLTGGIAAVAAGVAHTCAVTTDGAVRVLGGEQLRPARVWRPDRPVTPRGRDRPGRPASRQWRPAVAKAAPRRRAALLRCWGNNGDGQLGDGTASNRWTPVPVMGLGSGVTAVAVGWNHTCALTADGALRCWGEQRLWPTRGRDPWLIVRPLVAVVGLTSGVVALSAGRAHTCALTSGGTRAVLGTQLRWTTRGRHQSTDQLDARASGRADQRRGGPGGWLESHLCPDSGRGRVVLGQQLQWPTRRRHDNDRLDPSGGRGTDQRRGGPVSR